MFNPKVSIIIPVYNGSNYLCEAIDSALTQTYNNLEVLVINDGSNDKGATRDISISYDDRIRYFEKENGGVASALNLGIEKMEGEFFSWLSHDDLYMKNKVEKQVKLLNDSDNRNVIVTSNWILINEKGEELNKVNLSFIDMSKIEYYLLLDQLIHGCTLLIPRIAFDEVGMFPENLPTTQDYTLWLKLSEAFSFIHCNEVLVCGRQHKSQGSRICEHKREIHDFYKRELKRLSSDKILELFSKQERFDACFNLIQSLTNRGYLDCAHMVLSQTSDVFSDQEKHCINKIIYTKSKSRKLIGRSVMKIKSILEFIKFLNLSRWKNRNNNYELCFDDVYQNNLFEGNESLSGRGSNLDQTIVLRRELVPLLKKLKVKKFLDLPCGDYNWMRYIDFDDIDYYGGDVVESLVIKNQEQYGDLKHTFVHLDLTTSALPDVDVVFCRDCLVHLNYSQIFQVLNNLKKSKIKYLMTTTFTARYNCDLTDGIWRPINLQKAPFNFSEPMELLVEHCTEGSGKWVDKSIGVWEINSIKIK